VPTGGNCGFSAIQYIRDPRLQEWVSSHLNNLFAEDRDNGATNGATRWKVPDLMTRYPAFDRTVLSSGSESC